MVTAELAVTMPVVVILLMLLLGVARIGIDQVRLVDAARTSARAAARGDSPQQARSAGARAAPGGAQIVLSVAGDQVTARVQAGIPAPFGWLLPAGSLSADAVAQLEHGGGAGDG